MAFSIFDRDQSAKICQHDWKECLWVSEVAKFESDLLKADEDTSSETQGQLVG